MKNASDEDNKTFVILTMQLTRILILRHLKMMVIQIIKSSNKDKHAENQSQVTHWSATQREIDVENFSLQHGPTKSLGDNATAKDFSNQFLDDNYLDQIACYAIAYTHSKDNNNLTRKDSNIAQWNSDNP